MKILIIVLCFVESFDVNLEEEEFERGFPIMGFSLVWDQSWCLYVGMIFFYCSFMFHYIDEDAIFFPT